MTTANTLVFRDNARNHWYVGSPESSGLVAKYDMFGNFLEFVNKPEGGLICYSVLSVVNSRLGVVVYDGVNNFVPSPGNTAQSILQKYQQERGVQSLTRKDTVNGVRYMQFLFLFIHEQEAANFLESIGCAR